MTTPKQETQTFGLDQQANILQPTAHPYVLGDPVPLGVTHILMAMFILTSNILALVVIVRSNLAQTRPSVFVIHLIICDAYRGFIAFVTGIITLLHSGTGGMDYGTCRVVGFFGLSSACMGMFSVPLLLYDRLIFISSPVNYTHRMGKKLAAFLIIFNFLQALLIGVIPLNGWGRYDYNHDFGACTLHWMNSEGFPALYVIWVHFIPLVCSILCFSRIVFWMRKRICQVRINTNQIKLNMNMLQDPSFTEANLPMQLIGKTLFFILAIYYLSWLPYFIFTIIVIAGVNIAGRVDAIFGFVLILTMLTCLFNPWLYWLPSKRFRRSALSMLPCSAKSSYTETNVAALPPTISRSRSESLFVLNNYPMGTNPSATQTSC